MSTWRHRALDIVSAGVLACIALAAMTAVSTIARNAILQPKPTMYGLSVSVSAVEGVRSGTLVDRSAEMRNAYILGDGKTLESNVRPAPELLGSRPRPPHWPPTLEVMERTIDRMAVLVSGHIDFFDVWDWNTKAIYMMVFARYRTSGAAVNEVTVVDAVVRDYRAPRNLKRFVTVNNDKNAADTSRVTVDFEKMTEEEREQWDAFTLEQRSQHDAPNASIDHLRKTVTFNKSAKYYMEDFYSKSLGKQNLEFVVKYQVMSYTGYAPVREDVIGGHVVYMPSGGGGSVGGGGQPRSSSGGGGNTEAPIDGSDDL